MAQAIETKSKEQQLRSEISFRQEEFPRIGTLWSARLRRAFPEVVNLYAAGKTNEEAFQGILRLVDQEESSASKKAQANLVTKPRTENPARTILI